VNLDRFSAAHSLHAFPDGRDATEEAVAWYKELLAEATRCREALADIRALCQREPTDDSALYALIIADSALNGQEQPVWRGRVSALSRGDRGRLRSLQGF
jgi:hypothetical protein